MKFYEYAIFLHYDNNTHKYNDFTLVQYEYDDEMSVGCTEMARYSVIKKNIKLPECFLLLNILPPGELRNKESWEENLCN